MNAPSQFGVGLRLFVMMFIQFFIWGAWYVTVGNFLGARGMNDTIATAYSVAPIAAILSPIILGMLVDRYFAANRVLGVMHILGGISIALAPSFATPETSGLFALIVFLHTLFYMPTLSLTNTVAFHCISEGEKTFPLIRVGGTIGWIVAGIFVSKVLQADKLPTPFFVASGASILLGLYSFTLPHTPPPRKSEKVTMRDILCLDALGLMKEFPFAVFVISSLLICGPLAAYYAYAPVYVDAAGFKDPAFNMTFGQVSEIFFMLIMPLLFARMGAKWMLLIGMAAWVVRYGLFSAAAPDSTLWMIFGGILLHGICYDFFFVTGFIYTDKKAPANLRGQAQGLLVLVTQGIGMLIGAQLMGRLFTAKIVGENPGLEWQQFWLIPCIAAGVIMVAFGILFKDNGGKPHKA